MKTNEVILNACESNIKNTYNDKPRGYYDPNPVEVFFTRVGQEIFKFTVTKSATLFTSTYFFKLLIISAGIFLFIL